MSTKEEAARLRTARMGRFGRGLAILIALTAGSRAGALYTDGGSILLFPHVEAGEQWDTAIQIVNTSTNTIYADCHYVDFSEDPAQVEFSIILFSQQPTHWQASRGRSLDEGDAVCSIDFPSGSVQSRCDGAGFDPGSVPAVADGFSGYLICVQVDASGSPVSGNSLAGAATLRRAGSADTAKYEGIELSGLPANDADWVLCLGGDPSEHCPRGAEYQACPEEWHFNLPAAGAGGDIVLPAAESSQPSLTILPCGIDSAQLGLPIDLRLRAVNELGQIFTASARADGWLDSPLVDLSIIFDAEVLASELVLLQVAPAAGDPPFAALARIERASPEGTSVSFLHGHPSGEIAARVTLAIANGEGELR